MNKIHYSGKNIRVEKYPYGVKKLIFTRSDIRNAFHAEMIEEINSILSQMKAIKDENEMRLLILEGEGKVFCAGADLSYMKEQAKNSEEQNINDAKALGKMFYSLADFPCPVLSVAKGAAIGGGLGIIACSDFVICDENTIFATSEVLLGIVPAVISPYIIRKIGVGHSSSFLLRGKKMTAVECEKMGLINKVTDSHNLQKDLEKIILEFIMAAPNAARRTKDLIKNASPLPSQAQFDFTVQQIAKARSSEEGKAGLNSFFEKTTPFWCHGIKK
ncbi:enoyl-CoA hydratase-related protein [Fluviispira multicolorata]|uniref:Methylglutaconyl-CoA hydratase n=1 Tax=Fluviispira multicolorata TaxID=2654512 RepID=A0A833JG56_9BACT|nr:enoyl-CoA hydratase-related protein [Fluviispira multicolorata]KAB8033680.1 hypothetical protein GCL57_02945 [Fluviispira multicolorata]